MAHAPHGFLALTLTASLFAGCGGKTSGESETDPKGPFVGWHSYALVVSDATLEWDAGSFGSLSSISKGWTGRLDLDGSAVSGAIMAPFGEPQGLAADPAIKATLRTGKDLAFSISGTSGSARVTESYDTFTFELDAKGVPIGGTATGKASAFSGDVGWMGKVTAHFTLAADTTPPKWRGRTIAAFGAVPLVWDERELLADEPFGETLSAATVLGFRTPATKITTALAWGSPNVVRERGFRFRWNEWNDVEASAVALPLVHDAAGNASAAGSVGFVSGTDLLGVPILSTSSFDLSVPPSVTGSGAKIWGALSAADCEGKKCWAIGPFSVSYCGSYSQGGFATVLVGSGTATFKVRVVGKPRFTGSMAASKNVVHFLAASPGLAPSVDSTSVALPDKPGADGTYDTGFRTVTLTTPSTTATMTGVAISGGGVGPGSAAMDCGPAPPPVDLTVYVESVAVAGGK